jgi:hypothetical protein
VHSVSSPLRFVKLKQEKVKKIQSRRPGLWKKESRKQRVKKMYKMKKMNKKDMYKKVHQEYIEE